ncbi:MAG: hypothetical protein A2061_06490 [Gallionellales bacterium GWA2_59_43]|nr:MAG: hypothetical protein A2061_06490 [Gallionellales bacterium GWA2_59_43]
MATKKQASQQQGELARKSCEIQIGKDETKEATAAKYARLVASPEFAAYRVINSADGKTNIHNDVDVPSLVNELRTQAAAANRGDLVHAEAMLMNQAGALQTLFARLTERAMAQERMPHIEGFMRMALRAQSQCRATLETLAAIKNPPVVFAKQANINHGSGNQQVNNGTPAPGNPSTTRTGVRAHEGKTINQPNELLEVQHGGKTLDTRTTGATGGKNQAVAAVG